MIIELKYPYSRDWKNGYLVVNGENRRTVILYNSKSERSSTAYARYLMSVKLGRYLLESEQVDHIDEDKTNDDLDNLQLLSMHENVVKQNKSRGRSMVRYMCPVCNAEFSRRRKNSHFNNKQRTTMTCSRSCGNRSQSVDLFSKIIVLEEYRDFS